ncbi:hypothetical protein [Blautia sp. MSJ-19]|uniref:hypothetical protein n=1 Tax=Blautia sp. MSJ-19 TaxID=2841517 RepID=UPI001C0EC530|nr:hypothetical protein [Blautia sp. MSJ-19]MBU5481867.1 hypothetical protein [Blautia sp. MSJ-19]
MKPMRAKEAKELLNDIADRIDKIYTLTEKERETFEQAKLALESRSPKKPILRMNEKSPVFIEYADGHGECEIQTNNWWRCPECGTVVGERKILSGRKPRDFRKKVFCEKCGQKLKWDTGFDIENLTEEQKEAATELFTLKKSFVLTNADRIRSMTDEELAEWLHNIQPFEKNDDYYISMAGEGEQEIYIRDSYGDILEWMKTENTLEYAGDDEKNGTAERDGL